MSTPTLTPTRQAVARHHEDRRRLAELTRLERRLAELRRFVEREQHGGATVVRIEHVQAYRGWAA